MSIAAIVLTWLLCLIPTSTSCQEIAAVHMPKSVCVGQRTTITVGFDSNSTIALRKPNVSHGRSERIFLPDGVACGRLGCSYRSAVSFNGFPANATLSSVNDIQYVRINMEHSYVGDIYINLTCPNGQRVDIMKYGGGGESSCSGVIPSRSRNWLSGNNMTTNNYMGEPNDDENSRYKCDSTAAGNEPGEGWNYCWSNNSTAGYVYAAGDGIIYRAANAHNGHVDSSHVSAGRHFYHPDQSFRGLVGCPLNGKWYIEVVDGFSQDNGYIFEWEVALDTNLANGDCRMQSCQLTGNGVERVNDSTYTITTPLNITRDTILKYRLKIESTCGVNIDSVVSLPVVATHHHSIDTAACQQLQFRDLTYVNDTAYTEYLTGMAGCDSLVHISIDIQQPTFSTIDTTINDTLMPTHLCGQWFYHDTVATVLIPTQGVCDSVVNINLHLSYDRLTQIQKDICQNQLPYHWNSHTFTTDSTATDSLTTHNGYDSIVIMTLHVNPTYDTSITAIACDNVGYRVGTQTLFESGDHKVHLLSQKQCDSCVHLTLTAYPHSNRQQYDTVCKNKAVHFGNEWLHHSGTYVQQLKSIHECDSIETLHLTILAENMQANMQVRPLVVTPDQPTITLRNCSKNNSSVQWLINGKDYGDDQLSFSMPKELDSLPICLIATSIEGCTDTAIAVVNMDHNLVWLPNAFTPSNETNNIWKAVITDIVSAELWIFDRNGQLMMHDTSLSPSWDGTHNGTSCPQGSYVYTIKYTPRVYPTQTKEIHGTILLIR
ncbi:MAG: gliding motility-associated C-terminal domain-containing protein [Bacteroidales bacterium]|nr:gliding motility-associated C-terminal domain-containing protein [Bacteroidales bacterium]